MHLDSDTRISNQRHAGIVINNNKILLIYRKYKGKIYWVIPGGHIRIGEKYEEVVARELEEETGIFVSNIIPVFEFRDLHRNNFDYYYMCEYLSGELKLGGEELLKNCPNNFYEPQWVDLKKVKEINLVPKFAKEWIENNLN